MAAEILILAILSFLAAWFLFTTRPDLSTFIHTWRIRFFGIIGVIGAFILLSTGRADLMIAGTALLFLAWLWLFETQPVDDYVPDFLN